MTPLKIHSFISRVFSPRSPKKEIQIRGTNWSDLGIACFLYGIAECSLLTLVAYSWMVGCFAKVLCSVPEFDNFVASLAHLAEHCDIILQYKNLLPVRVCVCVYSSPGREGTPY